MWGYYHPPNMLFHAIKRTEVSLKVRIRSPIRCLGRPTAPLGSRRSQAAGFAGTALPAGRAGFLQPANKKKGGRRRKGVH